MLFPRLTVVGSLSFSSLVLTIALLCGCVTPAQRVDRYARDQHFQRELELGIGFTHVVYRNNIPGRGSVLHVYLEGDGTPYWQRDLRAVDPTPRDPVMLRLMTLDPDASVYIGRPCYFDQYRDPACASRYWTSHRYGLEVVNSLGAVLRTEIARRGASQVELFGHSGGGTLALLLANRSSAVTRVVTLAANLDVEAWCRLHGFTPLRGSLSPADEPAIRPGIRILHLVGTRDLNTPPWLVMAAAHARGDEPTQVIEGFDHDCCWQTVWPGILSQSP